MKVFHGDRMTSRVSIKRKLSTDDHVSSHCCKRLSVFACLCAVVSLVIHAYNFVESDWDTEAKRAVEKVLEDELGAKLEEYLSVMKRTAPGRVKREAMLVRIKFLIRYLLIIF